MLLKLIPSLPIIPFFLLLVLLSLLLEYKFVFCRIRNYQYIIIRRITISNSDTIMIIISGATTITTTFPRMIKLMLIVEMEAIIEFVIRIKKTTLVVDDGGYHCHRQQGSLLLIMI